tara:strand:+ start:7057 stop:7515 length:459 start_codon:yes stop_codon:yes gene_type:complete
MVLNFILVIIIYLIVIIFAHIGLKNAKGVEKNSPREAPRDRHLVETYESEIPSVDVRSSENDTEASDDLMKYLNIEKKDNISINNTLDSYFSNTVENTRYSFDEVPTDISKYKNNEVVLDTSKDEASLAPSSDPIYDNVYAFDDFNEEYATI